MKRQPTSPRSGRLIYKVITMTLIAGIAIGGIFSLQSTRSIFEMLTENRNLREAVTHLTEQRQIGYAKVLAQEKRGDKLFTRLLFVVTDPEDKNKRVLEREYEIGGDIVHFDALIVKFGSKVVMDGKERAMYLWRRVYGEDMAPQQGFPIEQPGAEPAQYKGLLKKLSIDERKMFWEEIWQLANDGKRLAAADVQAVYGSAVYTQLKPGLIYIFNLDSTGAFYPETVPAL